jgi:hypothetical protein
MGLVARAPYAGNLIAPLAPQVLTAIGGRGTRRGLRAIADVPHQRFNKSS